MSNQTYYKDGYDSSISQSHLWRTAKNSCSYMLNHVKPADKILDVGCGPGTITYDLAKYVPQGQVLGIEPTKELIEEALHNGEKSDISNVKFEEASVFQLPYPDESFDIVHAHQVIIHLAEPLKALKEMRRVLKKNGYLCFRDAEIRSILVYPEQYEDPIKYYFGKLRTRYTSEIGASRAKELTIKAGFEPANIINTTDSWCFSSNADREWYAQMYLKRLDKATFTKEDKYDKEQLQQAWEQWAQDETAMFAITNGEIVAKK